MSKRATYLLLMAFLMTCQIGYGWLQNPSFEDSEVADDWKSDRAQHWGRWGNWINRETGWEPTHTGKCMIGYHHWRVEEADDSGIYQDVPDIPSHSTCTFSIQAFKDANTNLRSVQLRLEPMGGGAPLASAEYKLKHFPDSRWRTLTVTGVNTDEGVRVLVVVIPKEERKRDGALKFDNAALEIAP